MHSLDLFNIDQVFSVLCSSATVQGVVKKFVTASNSLLNILIIIEYNKMFVDKYAIYTLSLVIFVYFDAFHTKPLLWQCIDDVWNDV